MMDPLSETRQKASEWRTQDISRFPNEQVGLESRGKVPRNVMEAGMVLGFVQRAVEKEKMWSC